VPSRECGQEVPEMVSWAARALLRGDPLQQPPCTPGQGMLQLQVINNGVFSSLLRLGLSKLQQSFTFPGSSASSDQQPRLAGPFRTWKILETNLEAMDITKLATVLQNAIPYIQHAPLMLKMLPFFYHPQTSATYMSWSTRHPSQTYISKHIRTCVCMFNVS
jgi:hypothetical protein